MPPHALTVTPEELFAEIRKIASTRFAYTIPEKIDDLVCLQTVNNKTSLLRDLCKAVGIQLVDEGKREFLLSNSLEQVLAHYNQVQQDESAAN